MNRIMVMAAILLTIALAACTAPPDAGAYHRQESVVIADNPIDDCPVIGGLSAGDTREKTLAASLSALAWRAEAENAYRLMSDLAPPAEGASMNREGFTDYAMNAVAFYEPSGGWGSYLPLVWGRYAQRDYRTRATALIESYMFVTSEPYVFVYQSPETTDLDELADYVRQSQDADAQ